jgi:xylan 1,4-beta-xylosidase
MKIAVRYLLALIFCCSLFSAGAQTKRLTYCNPLNLDYGYTPFETFASWGKHRATADPTMTLFKGQILPLLNQPIRLLVER